MGLDPRPRPVRPSGGDTYDGRVSSLPASVRLALWATASVRRPPPARGGGRPRPPRRRRRHRRPSTGSRCGATSASGACSSRSPGPATSAACLAARPPGRRGHRRPASASSCPASAALLVPTLDVRPRGRRGHPGDWTAYDGEPVPVHPLEALSLQRAGPALPPGAGRADPRRSTPSTPGRGRRPGPGDAPTTCVNARGVGAARRPAAAGRCGSCPRPRSSAWHRARAAASPRRRSPAPPTSAAGCCSPRCWPPPTGPSRPPPPSARTSLAGMRPGRQDA